MHNWHEQEDTKSVGSSSSSSSFSMPMQLRPPSEASSSGSPMQAYGETIAPKQAYGETIGSYNMIPRRRSRQAAKTQTSGQDPDQLYGSDSDSYMTGLDK